MLSKTSLATHFLQAKTRPKTETTDKLSFFKKIHNNFSWSVKFNDTSRNEHKFDRPKVKVRLYNSRSLT